MTDDNKYATAKRILKEWKASHHDEYCCFTDWMHDRDGSGFTEIFAHAVAFLPAFEKEIINRVKDDNADGVESIETLLKDNNLETHLLKGLNAPHIKGSIFLPMMAWLFFGRSFECMVEHGENLIKDKRQNFLMRIAIKSNIKMIIRRSIEIGARKESDWINFVEEQREMGDEPSVTVNAIAKFRSIDDEEKKAAKQSETKRSAGRMAKRRSLKELLPNGDKYLFDSLDNHVMLRNSGKDFAMLYIVLHEGQALARTNIVEFHAALSDRYKNKPNFSIPTPRSIQEGHKGFMELTTYRDRQIRTFERPEYITEFNDISEKLSVADYRYNC